MTGKPKCPKCGEMLVLVSIRCGRNPGRTYRCPNFRCQWESKR